MSFTGFKDYENDPIWLNRSWGRGFWDAREGKQITMGETVSPEHKIVYLDGQDFWYASWNKWCGSAINGGYYDKDFTRHYGGVNTIMLDGHGEYHKDADLGSGDGEYNNTTKRYWFNFIHEK